MSLCPGNPEGHSWSLVKEEADMEWVEEPQDRFGPFKEWREKHFGPLTSAFCGYWRHLGWKRRWACSHCRQVENTYEPKV